MYDYNFENKDPVTGEFAAGAEGNEYSYKKDQLPHGTHNMQDSADSVTESDAESKDTGASVKNKGYVDASYRPRQENGRSYGAYYVPPEKPKTKAEKKKNGRFSMTAVICLCLVCALLGGLAGGALVVSYQKDSDTEHMGGTLNISNVGQGTESQSITPVPDGTVMTGSEIYSMGCNQAVGVTTEITYRNYFGMETSSAVTGSGFIVTENGYVVTNYHVIADAYSGGYDISVMLYDGSTHSAQIVGVRDEYDLAVLKIDAMDLSAATLGNSDSLMVGDAVYAIGNPLGELNFSMTTGHVSALDRSITTVDSATGQATTNVMFQFDAAVNQGNSGGPIYNDRGEVVGIVTAKHSDIGVEGLGFAIPISDVVDIIEQFVNVGYVSGMPKFGITGRTVNSVHAAYYNMVEGVYVNSVESGSCSETAGMKAGDIITALNGKTVKSMDALENEKKSYRAGDQVTVTVFRSGEYLELELVFDEEPVTIEKTESKTGSLVPVPKP